MPKIVIAFNNKPRYVNQISKFDNNISFLSPIDIYIDLKSNIYILDSGLKMVLIYNKDNIPISRIDKSNGLNFPRCIAVSKDGLIYIGEELSGRKASGCISVFDPLGRKKKEIIFKGGEWARGFIPNDIEVDNKGFIYCAGGEIGLLVVLSEDGEFKGLIKPELAEKNKKTKDVHITVNGVALQEDSVFLLSESVGKIFVYDFSEAQTDNHFSFQQIRVFGQKGGSTGKLSRPKGLAVDNEKDICYVIDYMRHTLLIYNSSTGTLINEFGGLGWGPGWFQFPFEVNVDINGKIYIVDTFNNRIQIFDRE